MLAVRYITVKIMCIPLCVHSVIYMHFVWAAFNVVIILYMVYIMYMPVSLSLGCSLYCFLKFCYGFVRFLHVLRYSICTLYLWTYSSSTLNKYLFIQVELLQPRTNYRVQK